MAAKIPSCRFGALGIAQQVDRTVFLRHQLVAEFKHASTSCAPLLPSGAASTANRSGWPKFQASPRPLRGVGGAARQHLASAQIEPRAGPLIDNVPPQYLEMLNHVASWPGPRRGFGFSAPQPPGASSSDRANTQRIRGRKILDGRRATPAIVFSEPISAVDRGWIGGGTTDGGHAPRAASAPDPEKDGCG